MFILIDAYNLLRTVPPYKKIITEQERKQFIAQLNNYGRVKGHKIVLIFDGGPYEWPMKEKHGVVLVIYSGIHETADDYIREYIEDHKEKELLLVTSDRELNNYAAHFSVTSIDSYTFYQLIQEKKKNTKNKQERNQMLVKTTKDSKEDIDTIMINAAKIIIEKAEDIAIDKNRVSRKQQITKAEKKLLKKLRKL